MMKCLPFFGDEVVDVEHVSQVVTGGGGGVRVGVVATKDVNLLCIHIIGAGMTISTMHVGTHSLHNAPLTQVWHRDSNSWTEIGL